MNLRTHLLAGQVIPAHPLALTAERRLSERHQRALTRYYAAAGAGGMAVAVHTTQFAIREPQYGLLRPVLELASETADAALARNPRPFVRIAGVCGRTAQAAQEAALARSLGYHAGLLSLSAWKDADLPELLAHCREVAEILPVFGFYLQPAVGGRVLPYAFWREFAEIENVVAIKIAPFNRYQTLDVVRAVVESGRTDIALYTGNDDTIVTDLLTPFAFAVNGRQVERRIVGGLLGHWSVWTRRAVELLTEIQALQPPGVSEMMLAAVGGMTSEPGRSVTDWLRLAAAVTDTNAAFFDAANGFAGCIAGLHEVLRRQRLLPGIWCLDPREGLSPGQAEEIDRIYQTYPELNDDAFVAARRDEWLR